MATTRRPKRTAPPPRRESERTPEPETAEPESGEPFSEEHARELIEGGATATCKRCGGTYTVKGITDCTDRRCPLKK